MIPTPGRMVLFVLRDGITIRPAHVIDAIEDRCCLQVLLKPVEKLHESDYRGLVPFCAEGRAETWHWPHFSTGAPASRTAPCPVCAPAQAAASEVPA